MANNRRMVWTPKKIIIPVIYGMLWILQQVKQEKATLIIYGETYETT